MNKDKYYNIKIMNKGYGKTYHEMLQLITNLQQEIKEANDSITWWTNRFKAVERDNIKLHNKIWECACGNGHLSKLLETKGYEVLSTDLIDRGYGIGNIDFLDFSNDIYKDFVLTADILTNPPYKYAKNFVEHAIDILADEYYCVMYLKIQFLEGKERRKLFDKYPPKYVYVNSSRQTCYINGDMSKKMSSASCYCWYIWQKGFHGETIVRWI